VTISDRYFQRSVLAAMIAGFVLLLIAGAASVVSARRNQAQTERVNHTYQVTGAIDHFSILAEQLETARRGYILQQNDFALRTYANSMRELPGAVERIARLTADNPAQRLRVINLRAVSERHRASARTTIELMRNTNTAMRAMADFEVDSSFEKMWRLRAVAADMKAIEVRLLAVRNAAQARSTSTLYIVLGVTALLIVLVMGGVVVILRRYTDDLNASQDRLRDLNTGLEGAVADRTTELSRANDEIQRFAYIVSHDLRSPLVNVMGFTAELEATIGPLTALADRVDAAAPELMARDAREALDDLPESIRFIRTSTNKMDRLINSILRLSREGRRTLAPAPVDLAALTATIRDNLQFRLTELGAEIAIETPMAAIVSDRLALEQILSNLVENATKYLAPGRPGRIVVSARREGRRVVIDVADNGRGVAPADHERIFELFRRSGVQDQPGEGLGLAHVRALSYRLGGVIGCISELGEGATFRLSLPDILKTEPREGIAA